MKPSTVIGQTLSAGVLIIVFALRANASTNAPSLPDLQTPGVMEVIESSRSGLAQIDKDRKTALSTLLNRYLGIATEMLDEKKKTRNVSGIAAATAGITIFQTALTNLEINGKFELPEKIRREIENSVAQCKSEAASIETKAADKKKAFFATTLESFWNLAARANTALDASAKPALEARLTELLTIIPVVKPPLAAKVGASTPDGTSTNIPAGAITNLPEILASSGEAEQWATVASWHGAMMGMDLVSIPVASNNPGTTVTRQFNPMSGQDSVLTHTVRHRLTMQAGMLFRLKRVANTNDVELIEWPTRDNGYQLIVRTRSDGHFPSHHAFELQVSVPGADLSSVLSGTAIEGAPPTTKPLPPLTLTLVTIPEGASVYVDDVLQKNIKTPCRVSITKGNHSLGLTLQGYTPLIATNYTFNADRTIKWSFQPDPRIQRKSITVSASAASWTASDASIGKGDTIIIRASGQWSCAPGRELCDATGYPNNEAFYRYYMDSAAFPRHTSSAGYGALLMRIGKEGRILPLGKDLKSSQEVRIAASESGMLFFDVNEMDASQYRADNTGAIIVTFTIIPAITPVAQH